MNSKAVDRILSEIESKRLSRFTPNRSAPKVRPQKKSKRKVKRQRVANSYERFNGRRTERQKEYDKYLKGSWWRKRRKAYLLEHPNCSECGSIACIQVHHVRYKDADGSILGREADSDLQSLCNVCHGKEHGLRSRILTWKDY